MKMIVVLGNAENKEEKIESSRLGSRADDASSKIRNWGFERRAWAKKRRCNWPPENLKSEP
tara:strand:+ start:478 stop:660 length:183 start_codon:yes stop_codon:yes gene_type:complete